MLALATGCAGASPEPFKPGDSGAPGKVTPSEDAGLTDTSTDSAGPGSAEDSGAKTNAPPMDAAAPPADTSTSAPPVEAGADAPATGCGAYAGDTSFTCSSDGNSRGECGGETATVQACPNGCLREPAGQDSICMGTTDNWSCNGSYGTEPALDGNYDLTEFGCYIDSNGTVQTDPGDNCIPACLSQAQSSGLCDPNGDGPSCEESVNWYVADGARFGCLQRVRITNLANGLSVIAVALDLGPSCSVESVVSGAVLDASYPVNQYLFGSEQGVSDMAAVHVVEVDNSTPLGPVM